MAAKTLEKNKNLLRKLEVGDLIEFPRRGYGYSHWAVYMGNEEVVHLAGLDGGSSLPAAVQQTSSVSGSGIARAEIRAGSFWDVVGNSKAKKNNILDNRMNPLTRAEIVHNARSRIGATADYNVLFKNCEHFATWCRYGISTSQQAQDFLQGLGIGTSVVALGWFAALFICFSSHSQNN